MDHVGATDEHIVRADVDDIGVRRLDAKIIDYLRYRPDAVVTLESISEDVSPVVRDDPREVRMVDRRLEVVAVFQEVMCEILVGAWPLQRSFDGGLGHNAADLLEIAMDEGTHCIEIRV